MMKNQKGKVYLIGAGPGDEGLMTLKGARYLSLADVIVYDYLSSDALLSMARPGSEKIYVGKKASRHTLSQKEINALLVGKAQEGRVVVRLKGGDPYVFGRGGEEALALAEADIEFEVVPGITAGVGAAAYAGIPFTHRGIASTAGFITGHETEGKDASSIDWKSVAGLGTIVFYMGVRNLSDIVKNLKSAGRAGDTPSAIVQWGTLPFQRSAEGTLDTIVEIAGREGISSPALIIIGNVVALRPQLNWFEKKPLFGKTILVTRSRTRISELASLLKDHGAEVIEFPTIRIVPIVPNPDLDGAIASIPDYSWIFFTSVNSVEIFMCRVMEVQDARILGGIKIGVIGLQTGRCLNRYSIRPDLVPDESTSEGILESLKKRNENLTGKKILIPGSSISRNLLPLALSKMGALVDAVPVYGNMIPDYSSDYIDSVFNAFPDVVTFTSSSTVKNLMDILKRNNRMKYISRINGASIGPETSKSIRKAGIHLALEASLPSIGDLVSEIVIQTVQRKNK